MIACGNDDWREGLAVSELRKGSPYFLAREGKTRSAAMTRADY
jgi:hypothetical protein